MPNLLSEFYKTSFEPLKLRTRTANTKKLYDLRFRQGVASHFEAGGGDAMALLGHSQRRVTEGYLDPRIVDQKHAVDILFRPLPH